MTTKIDVGDDTLRVLKIVKSINNQRSYDQVIKIALATWLLRAEPIRQAKSGQRSVPEGDQCAT